MAHIRGLLEGGRGEIYDDDDDDDVKWGTEREGRQLPRRDQRRKPREDKVHEREARMNVKSFIQ